MWSKVNNYVKVWFLDSRTCLGWASTFVYVIHIGIAKRPHLLRNLVIHHEASDLHPIYETSFLYLASNQHTTLLLYVFWIFFLASHAILESRCVELFWILSMYSKALSMTMISMGSDSVSRRRRMYGVCY